jgi:hypothetical protein
MASSTALAVQFRIESILVVAIVALVVVLYARDEIARPRLWWAAALGVGLCAMHAAHLAAVRNEAWGSAGPRIALAHVWPNLTVNGPFFANNARFPALYSAIALVGLAARPRRAALVGASYFLAFWGVFLFFYAGSYNYGADVRFSLMCYPGLAVLAGLGAARVRRWAVAAGMAARRATFWIVAAVAMAFLSFMPQIRAVGEEAWAARADVAFAHRVMPELPPNSIVLTHDPALFHFNHISAAQMFIAAQNPGYVLDALVPRYTGGVFVHWGFWCNVADAAQRSLCATVLGQLPNDLVREYRERDYRYAFYRLNASSLGLRLKPALRLRQDVTTR